MLTVWKQYNIIKLKTIILQFIINNFMSAWYDIMVLF